MPKSQRKTPTVTDRLAVAPLSVAEMRRAPTHPGQMFRLDYREPLRITQVAMSRRLGWTTNRMNEFELGKRALTVKNTIAIGELTRTSPEFWLRLQMRYDLWHALRPGTTDARRRKRPALGRRRKTNRAERNLPSPSSGDIPRRVSTSLVSRR